ncbi:hypothetical protein E5F05_02650 (plasmid) [Deinococcus metallilatus]|uniref:Uncharacterized protein n=1 Tax=Deinococcus metallilatus TaxID=1211322 RepID=A0AAJ5F7L6_9DEIO|nr:hypothetical protein [Deinococcus metallilatus]MBB5295700.1 hypothetical protein [Deinococcus metallilatus]QBY06851.1 hypothetical protein E5F05_02650 [Deinococcus metallilatus]TLK32240.1 hypothetical protein FCS05_01985 [Deinococcus metallilatus]GMA14232.1 hypothetical protein GCM10025871_05630 [Deinococcus metallilatus]
MRTNHNILTPLLAATFLAGSAFAAGPTTAQRALSSPPPQAQRAPQAVQVAYYRGDPLKGGQLLTTASVTPRTGGQLFQNAPGGATYAVVTTPFGRRVVNLQATQARGRPDGGGPGDAGGSRGGGVAQPGSSPTGEPGHSRGPAEPGGAQGPRDRLGVLGGVLRGASSVTFYTADPLQGGRAVQTLQLSVGAGDQDAALTQAARQARFAVVERGGETLIVDLNAAPLQPGQPASQDPQRR